VADGDLPRIAWLNQRLSISYATSFPCVPTVPIAVLHLSVAPDTGKMASSSLPWAP
jgi:hypothetical protein